MKKLIKGFCAVLALAMVLTAAGCASSTTSTTAATTADTTAASGSDTTAASGGTLTLATSADFPPYEYLGDSGDFEGIDIEIAQAIAEKLGMTLQVENMDFDSVVTSVSAGKYDMGMAGLTVTDERKESVDFSDSYATGVQVVIVPTDSPITSVDDLYADGATYTVGVQLSTTGDIYFSSDIEKKLTTCSIEEYKSGADAIAALVSGKINAVIIDNEPAKSFVAANTGLKILDTEYTNEDYAICFKKGNTELEDKVNSALKELISDGTVKSIVDKYITAD